ncbi:transporter substrate-binding domain-containing protein [Allochromatium palmeri]|uniref:Transporter substrate-binding domain-containing protein n=1 Tax=Allochromatium palmeri TaxID=231048 RepID=A0A6N8EGJ3_9GAMM|nr:transporter substrate-binding domain-containing protein [Allochromatium palmeri]MTW21607.1 transporter substrate-binding domain-containing protein [Allochromatium palmeri]
MTAYRLYSLAALLAGGLLAGFTTTAADLPEIKARGELRHLGIRYANFVTGTGDGFDAELTQGFADYLGVDYTLVYSDFYSVIRDLLGKNVVRSGDSVTLEGDFPIKGDMIASGFTVLPWREQILLYSEPTFPSQVMLIARADSPIRPIQGSEDLAKDIQETKALIGSQSLLVMEKTCLDPANYGLQGQGIELRVYTKSSNINEMVPALLHLEADLSLLDVPDLMLDMQKWAGTFKVIGPISEEQTLAAAFPKDAPQLRDAFNDYLRQIKVNGTYDRLVQKYYPGARSYFPAFFAEQN